LVIARKTVTSHFLSFEEKDYALNADADKRTKGDLRSEFEAVQLSSRKLFESFNDEQLQNRGRVNYSIDVNALGFVVPGHILHHIKLIKE